MKFSRRLRFLIALCILSALRTVSAESDLIDLARPEGLAAIRMAEGFEIELAAPKGMVHYPMCAALDDRGRLYVTESSGKDVSGKAMAEHPECRISVLEDTDGDGIYDRSTVFTENLSLPMGVLWHEGNVFVATPPDFVRLRDTNDDGRADEREVMLTGWNVLNTASLHGPFLGPDGWLYLTHGRHGYKITTKEGETLEGLAPRIWRCRPDGTGLERVCGGGFDNPVELLFTPIGEMLLTMTYFTDPQNGQRDALLHLVEGGVYSKYHECVSEFKRSGDFMPVMTKFARIAPAGFMQWRGEDWGSEFANNLYSAQFNPHRVQRHVPIREGSTYRTEDSDFLVSSDPDFHPTDVLQDADGTMIVLDTGGWYVDACPLSKISKPDLLGGIYRVRKTGANRPLRNEFKDPRHDPNSLEYNPMLENSYPGHPVLDLIPGLKPPNRVDHLAHIACKGSSIERRCDATWALMRNGSDDAMEELRDLLDNDAPEVRAAAAMALGRARDEKAARTLAKLARKDEPIVRRAAAEAIGAIGGERTSEWLLEAAPEATDRFIEHAIINGLTKLEDAEELQKALKKSDDPRTIQCALVALDQMDDSPLAMESVAPLLRHEDAALRNAALWVAAHHEDGGEAVAALLAERLASTELDDTELVSLREAALAFAGNSPVQSILAERLNDPASDETRKLYLLGIIAESKVGELPEAWTTAVHARLSDSAEPVRTRAVSIIRARNIENFNADLARIADDATESSSMRLTALSAIQKSGDSLDSARYEFLVAQLDPAAAAPSRLSAAQILGSAKLAPEQLTALATNSLAHVDAMALAPLLAAFEGSDDGLVGVTLKALTQSEAAPRVLNSERLDKLTANLSPETQRLADPLRAKIAAEDEARLRKIRDFEPLLSGGDVGRGRQVFFGKKAGCGSCHAIGSEGGRLGPDLTTIGQIRSGRDLLEAIIFPSATFVPGYEPFRIETSSDVLSGIIAEQDSTSLLLRTGADAEVRLTRDHIRAMDPSTVSVMPEGLDAGLDKTEFLDLMAFLQAQNGEQWLLADRRQEMKIPLFNGKDLTGFTPWLEGETPGTDPRGVFSVADSPEGPALQVNGTQTGYLATKARARNYRLVAEFKANPNSSLGLLVHADPEKDKIWPNSIHVEVKPTDTENQTGWNTLEVVCDDDNIRVTVNGVTVREESNVDPKIGRILIQSNRSLAQFRRLDLYPLY